MPANSTLSSSPMDTPACEKDAEALQFIEEITKNADAVQKDELAQILSQNAQTEYLKGFNLDGATDRETFKSKIPMVTYEDIQPLIQRIANGDRSPILSAHLITEFLTRYVKGVDKGKAVHFWFTSAATKTRGGLVAQPASTSFYKSFSTKIRPYDPYYDYTSPNEAIFCVDSFQSMYTQMLCGLYECWKVLRVGAIFASGLIRAIKFLQLNWQQLTHDIRTGSLDPKVTDPSIRECMTRVLRPDPNLADFITKECEKDSWEGIISRIWPNAKCLDTIVTGAMTQYVPTLDYYSGLYRYQVGDIFLRVTSFHNSAPQFQFIKRKNAVLSIDMDKTDEAELQAAIENASQLLHEFNTGVVEYTSYADTTTIPDHYVIYWELLTKDSKNSPTAKVLNQCCLAMEESLNSVYRRCRVVDNSIGPLEIRIVKNGTFEELMDYAISKGTASIAQYKVPRCVNFTPIVDLLNSRVMSTYFSPSLPYWTAERRL